MVQTKVFCVSVCLAAALCLAAPTPGSPAQPPRPTYPLQQAAHEGDLEQVKGLLAQDQSQYLRDSALRLAIQAGHTEVAELLISHGARYALMIAAEAGDIAFARHLLVKGQTANERDSALFAAARAGNEEIVELLLSEGADVNARRFGDYTPLFVAVAAGCDLETLQRFTNFPLSPWTAQETDRKRSPANPEVFRDVVKLLLKHGADVTLSEKQHGFVALHYAVFGGSREIVAALLEGGAPAHPPVPSGNLSSRYLSPLHLAAHYGDMAICELLISRGADVDAKLPTDGGMWIYSTRRTPLHHAVESRDGKLVALLLKAGAEVNAADSKGRTPLHGACEHADASVVETLLAHGARVNAADSEGRTSLHMAAERKDLAIVRLLLSHGADPARKSRDGQTPTSIATQNGSDEIVRLLTARPDRITIHSAASTGDIAALERLVREGIDVNRLDVQGQTALHAAANAGRLEALRWLVERGAWLDLADDQDATALSLAIRQAYKARVNLSRARNATDLEHKYKAVMAYLISRGAKPEFSYGIPQEQVQVHSKEIADLLIEAGPDLGLCHDSQATLLHRAAWWGRKKAVEALIELGADLNAADMAGGTPLHAAIQEGSTPYWDVIEGPHTDIMKLLLEHGAKADVANKDGRTALHGSASRGDVNAVSLLIEHGADVNAGDGENRTPLDLATGRSRQKVVDLLVSKGAKTVEERRREGTARHDERGPVPVSRDTGIGVRGPVPWKTPLHQAVEKGDIEAVRSLLAQGADINAKSWNSETPLGTAVYHRQKEIVALLLSHGAEVNSAYTGNGLFGTIPLHLALRSHQAEIAEMLVKAGSDVNAQGGYGGIAPLHLALDNRALFELMLEHGGLIDAPSGNGMTCLHRAAMGGLDEMAEYFIDKGALVNVQDNDGNTPLHLAAKGGHAAVCKVLLAHQADIHIKNKKGLLPLHYAQASDLTDIIVDLTPKMP